MTRADIQQRLAQPVVTTVMAWATAFVTAAILVMAMLYWPQISDGQDAQIRNQQVQGCRSASASLVTAARTDFDVARAERDTEATHLELLVTEALEAVAVERDELAAVVERIRLQRVRVTKAEALVVEQTVLLRQTQTEHERRTLLSLEDVDEYLSECNQFARESS